MDGEVIYGNPASYLFEETGSYDVRLDVQSPEGCVSTLTIPAYITIHPLPKPKFYATPNPTTYFNTEVTLVNIDPVFCNFPMARTGWFTRMVNE